MSKKPMEWVIYYKDGSMVDSSICEPKDVPKSGAEVVLSKSEDNRWITLSGSDFYYYRRYDDGTGEWYFAKDIHSLRANVVDDVFRIESAIEGLTMRTSDWEALNRKVRARLKRLKQSDS